MKQFRLFATLLAVALCTTIVTSCSKDDDNSSNKGTASIIGKWYVTDVYYQGTWILAKNAGNEGAYAQFNSDLSYRGTYCTDCGVNNGTYVYNNNVATCKVGAATITYTFSELTENTAIAELDELGTKTKFKAEKR